MQKDAPMCSAPDVEDPTTYQSAESPVYKESTSAAKKGRSGTVLTGGSGSVVSNPTGKKTLLGQ